MKRESYTANSLNQYSSREVPAYLNVLGIAYGNVTLLVNTQTGTNSANQVMKTKFSTVVAWVLLASGCASVNDLGHGFKLHPRAENFAGGSGAFESRAHYKDLFYRSQKLGEVGKFSIAPSGCYALFEDKGKLLLFDARSGQTRDVTDGQFEIPKVISWRESEGKVVILYYKNHQMSEVRLKP